MTEAAPPATPAPRRSVSGYLLPLAGLVAGTLLVVLFVAPGPLRPGGDGADALRGDEGPLASDSSGAVSVPHLPGDLLTFGHIVLSNTGPSTAVLDNVTFDPPLPENLRLLGVQVASEPDREFATVGAIDGYPPAGFDIGRLVPLKGATVPSKTSSEGERGAALIMGFRFGGGDLASFRQVHVEYRVGSRRYRAKLDQALIVCLATAYPDGCPDSDEVYSPD